MKVLLVLILASVPLFPQDDLLKIRAERFLSARQQLVNSLDPDELRRRQAEFRQWLIDAIGGLPQRTPLRPRITGTLDRDGYRIEKIIFESQPRFYVTANVYVPARVRAPFPAVIGVAGHSNVGKAEPVYQHVWISLARRGFLVIAIDPPGQGERSEYFDSVTGKSSVGLGVPEHNMAGIQCLLTGAAFARYEIWDGIRAFDYLLTRADVDPKRIAVAGNSGGGTQSAYLAAIEPRLAAAVVSCYITSWRDQWDDPGPQDAEQDFPGFVSSGWDFADFLLPFAPRPVTMLTAIRDFFPIAGARSTYAEVQRSFQKLDAPGRVGYFEYDDTHGWNKPRRQATYRWLCKWLTDREEDGTEEPLTPEPPAVLNATETGQLATSLAGETTQSLNAAIAGKLYSAREAANADAPRIRRIVAAALHLEPLQETLLVNKTAEDPQDGVPTTRLEVVLPAGQKTTAREYGAAGQAVITLGLDQSAHIRLANNGSRVLALDPREARFTGQGKGGYDADWQTGWRALLVGDSIIAMQVRDILAIASWARSNGSTPRLIARGHARTAALLAAALDPQIASVSLDQAVTPYLEVAKAKRHNLPLTLAIPGVLRHFDIPDLTRAISPRPVCITPDLTAGCDQNVRGNE